MFKSYIVHTDVELVQVREVEGRFWEGCGTGALLTLEKYGLEGSDLEALPDQARTLLQDKDTLLNALQVFITPSFSPSFSHAFMTPIFKLFISHFKSSLVCSSTHQSMHPLITSRAGRLIQSFARLCVCSFTHAFVHSVIAGHSYLST